MALARVCGWSWGRSRLFNGLTPLFYIQDLHLRGLQTSRGLRGSRGPCATGASTKHLCSLAAPQPQGWQTRPGDIVVALGPCQAGRAPRG